jgi:hypothetical protein
MDEHVDKDSSPGYPWMKYGSTNEQAFGYVPMRGYGEHVEELYWKVLDKMLMLEKGESLETINVFVKDEPHKLTKAHDGAWRLISGLSLTDQMVAHLFLQEPLEIIGRYPGSMGIMVGWSPFQHGGFSYINQLLKPGMCTADRSSWDWTVEMWCFEELANFTSWLYDDRDDALNRVLVNHVLSVGRATMARARGKALELPEGIQKSGWLWTTFANSWWQIFVHYCAEHMSHTASSPPYSIGDDTVQWPPRGKY